MTESIGFVVAILFMTVVAVLIAIAAKSQPDPGGEPAPEENPAVSFDKIQRALRAATTARARPLPQGR